MEKYFTLMDETNYCYKQNIINFDETFVQKKMIANGEHNVNNLIEY